MGRSLAVEFVGTLSSVFARAGLSLGTTLPPRALRGCATRSPKGEGWWSQADRTADLIIANDALSQLSYGLVQTGPCWSNRPAIGAIYSPAKAKCKNSQNGRNLASFVRKFPCLCGSEPIFSWVIPPREPPATCAPFSISSSIILDLSCLAFDRRRPSCRGWSPLMS